MIESTRTSDAAVPTELGVCIPLEQNRSRNERKLLIKWHHGIQEMGELRPQKILQEAHGGNQWQGVRSPFSGLERSKKYGKLRVIDPEKDMLEIDYSTSYY